MAASRSASVWVPARAAGSGWLLWSILRENAYFTLQRSRPAESRSLASLVRAVRRQDAERPFRILLRDADHLTIAEASTLGEISEAWAFIERRVMPAIALEFDGAREGAVLTYLKAEFRAGFSEEAYALFTRALFGEATADAAIERRAADGSAPPPQSVDLTLEAALAAAAVPSGVLFGRRPPLAADVVELVAAAAARAPALAANASATQATDDPFPPTADRALAVAELDFGARAAIVVLIVSLIRRQVAEDSGLFAQLAAQLVFTPDEVGALMGAALASPTATDDSIATLAELDVDAPAMLAFVLAAAVGSGRYDARVRATLRDVARLLSLSWARFIASENELAAGLAVALDDGAVSADVRAKSQSRYRGLKIGGALVVGGAALFLTGGFAAPLVGAVLGASAAAATPLALGAVGAGFSAYKMERRTAGLEHFAFTPLHGARGGAEVGMHMVIAVSGWLGPEPDSVLAEWTSALDGLPLGHVHVLDWEPSALRALGVAFASFVRSTARGLVVSEVLKRTVLGAATVPLSVLGMADVLDNPWAICIDRAEKAGALLADVLASQVAGARPVTLVGYSCGARVIFDALAVLAKRSAPHIVCNVVLIGGPIHASADEWAAVRSVVAGSLVNVYQPRDLILSLLSRVRHITTPAAGSGPVLVPGVVNINASSLVDGHVDIKAHLAELVAQLLPWYS